MSHGLPFAGKKTGKVTFWVFHPLSWEIGKGDGVENGILGGQASVSASTSLILDIGNTQCSQRL